MTEKYKPYQPCHNRILFIFLISILFPYSTLSAQIHSLNELDAKWVNTLASYTSWKNKRNNNIGICTLAGTASIYKNLIKLNEKLSNSNIYYKEINIDYNLSDCDILYISQSEINDLPEITKKATKNGILTVSRIKNFVYKGGIIEFSQRGNYIDLKVNLKNAKKSNIILNGDLLAFTTNIY